MKKIIDKILLSIRRLKLKQRLIILTILVVLLPMLLIIFMILTYSKNTIQDSIVLSTRNTINQISQNVDEIIIGQIYNVTNMLNYDNRIHELLTNRNDGNYSEKDKITDEVIFRRLIFSQYIYREDIRLVALYGKNEELYNFSFPLAEESVILEKTKSMAQLSRENKFVVQWYPKQENFFTTEVPKDPRTRYVTMASRAIVNPATGEYVGTQIYAISEGAIFEKYDNVKLGKTGMIFVMDRSGGLISHSREEELVNSTLDSNIIKQILKRDNDVFPSVINGEKAYIITKTSEINQWITVGIVPEHEIYMDINKIFLYAIVIIAACAAILIFSVVVIAGSIVKPITTIVRSMDMVEKGDLSVQVSIKGDYEVSKLGSGFNKMISRIRYLIEEEYELEKRKKEAELNVLMAQINPHFLYNTLESIVWKAKIAKAYDISKMASSLGKLFRIAVNRGNIIVPVNEEIEHVKAYVYIQKFRYNDKFDFQLNIPDERVKEYKTLKLMLQPVVENAIIYGIEPSDRKGLIQVDVLDIDNKLVFNISDNGVGILAEKINEIDGKLHNNMGGQTGKRSENGIGLKNVHDRIQLYFGKEYGVKVKSTFGEGTTITLELPRLDE